MTNDARSKLQGISFENATAILRSRFEKDEKFKVFHIAWMDNGWMCEGADSRKAVKGKRKGLDMWPRPFKNYVKSFVTTSERDEFFSKIKEESP